LPIVFSSDETPGRRAAELLSLRRRFFMVWGLNNFDMALGKITGYGIEGDSAVFVGFNLFNQAQFYNPPEDQFQ
jgi:hypothetical protein